jgi:hypothetical protein
MSLLYQLRISEHSHSSPVPQQPQRVRQQLGILRLHRAAGNQVVSHLLNMYTLDLLAPSARSALDSSVGHPLDPTTRAFMESRFGQDLSDVLVHTGARVAASAQQLNARAFTLGHDIAFAPGQYAPATLEGQRLLAHELVHTVQQAKNAGASLDQLEVSDPADSMERQAEQVSGDVFSQGPVSVEADGAATIARQVAESQTEQAQKSLVEGVIQLLDKKDPIAGVGDPVAAFNLLIPLSISDLLSALTELNRKGYLDILIGGAGAIADKQPRLVAAMAVVDLKRTNGVGTTGNTLTLAGDSILQLTTREQDEILAYVGVDPATLNQAQNKEPSRAEALANLASSSGPLTGSTAVLAAVTGPVGPGPWNPPGGQPIPFYIGNVAHVAIAAEYAVVHGGDIAFYNFTPVSSILDAWSKMGISANIGALTPIQLAQLALRPDIINLSRHHLYEIKPEAGAALGLAKADVYIALFVAAGVPITLGPTNEPGTMGVIPAPDGYYIFQSPEPGLITYAYRKGRYQPVRVTQPEEQTQTDPGLLKRISIATGITSTAGLIIYLIISEGSRVVIPPRNLIPAP